MIPHMPKLSWVEAIILAGALAAGCRRAALESPPPPVETPRALDSPEGETNATETHGEPDAAIASDCDATLERARLELLRRGFAPTDDTARWLFVSHPAPDSVELSIVMRQSADGAATWFGVRVAPGPKGTTGWQRRTRKYCCDDHASEDDHLKELILKRRRGGKLAAISIVYFGDLKSAEYAASRELFAETAQRAADECLAP
jgi:hypothetical protein